MRLYKKVKPIVSGTTLENNKGIMVLNSDVGSEYVANILNTDGSLTGVTFSIGPVTVSPASPANPNFSIVPFRIFLWNNLGNTNLKAYELY